jgi:hypothetical protein
MFIKILFKSNIQLIDLCLFVEWLFIKSWIFNVFQMIDTSNHLIERGYPLWFFYETDALDDFISIGYLLWFVIELDSLNDLI